MTSKDCSILINGHQLREALSFLAPDNTEEQLDQEVIISTGGAECHSGPGLYCWLDEYPEEGAIKLDGTSTAAPTPPASEHQRAVALSDPGEPEHHSASTAAIQFALELEDLEDMPAFLSMWNEGEFETIRRAWPDCPDEVFIGADPLFKPSTTNDGGTA